MKGSMQAAAAIGIGYVLGRRRKFRAAAMMAAGMTVGGTTVGSLILKRGLKMLGSTEAIQKVAPQLGDLADTVRGDLVTVGKAAATAAVSSRVDALTDSIHDRAERVRNPAGTVAEGADKATRAGKRAASTATSAAGGTASRVTGRRRAEAEEADLDDYEDDDYDDGRDDDEGGRDDDEGDDRADEADSAPAPRTATRRRSPVARVKR
jgi:hypothetical protein